MPLNTPGDAIREMKAGDLHSGSKSGPVVKDKAQALAIFFSEKRQYDRGRARRKKLREADAE